MRLGRAQGCWMASPLGCPGPGLLLLVILVLGLTFVMVKALPVPKQGFSPEQDQPCDVTIWDTTNEVKGVRQVSASCSEGRVDWRYPYGAVRLTLDPKSGNGDYPSTNQDYLICFKASVHLGKAKISRELESSGRPALQTLVTLDSDTPSMQREKCLSAPRAGPVTLYIEVDTSADTVNLGRMIIDYALEQKRTSNDADMWEDCKPCSNDALLQAACTSDFMVRARMETLTQHSNDEETELLLRVTTLFRQKKPLFTRTKADPSLKTVWSEQHASNVSDFTGSVHVPSKCGVRKDKGDYLFVGHIRLDRALVKCAPRWQQFQQLWDKAVEEGTNPCVLD